MSGATQNNAPDDRIAQTPANKAELLRVLELPELPLDNNDAALGFSLGI